MHALRVGVGTFFFVILALLLVTAYIGKHDSGNAPQVTTELH